MKEVQLPEAIKLSEVTGKVLQGYYIGKRKVEHTKNESGESLLHIFQEKDGTEVEVWSFDILKRKLSKIPIGSFVKLEYKGTLQDGNRTIHQVNVYYDDKDKISISEN